MTGNQSKLFCCLCNAGDHPVLNQKRKQKLVVNSLNEVIESDGRLCNVKKDPPGQKSNYVAPGDATSEIYRLSTFKKFSEDIPIDVPTLAAHGFYYTGYKDRVKCFSCGSTVQDWCYDDVPNTVKWHFAECQLVLGTDRSNQPFGRKTLRFVSDVNADSIESGYLTMSDSMSSTSQSSLRSNCVRNANADSYESGYLTMSGPMPSSSQALQQSNDRTSSSSQKNSLMNNSITGSSDAALLKSLNSCHIDEYKGTAIESSLLSSSSSSSSLYRQTARVASPKHPQFLDGLNALKVENLRHYHFLKSLNLAKEIDRRKSFVLWSFAYGTVTPETLAFFGFFYLGSKDKVQCFSCSGVIQSWQPNDDVESVHKLKYPNCRMILRIEARNIPISLDESFLSEPPDPSPEEVKTLERLFPCLQPINPHMLRAEDREKSFDERWPSHKVNASIRQIAKAGFYFLGVRDRAKCWYCNGGLQNWEQNDEPFSEHAKWFPGCEFILRKKGIDFVMAIANANPNLKRPPLRNPRLNVTTREILPAAPSVVSRRPAQTIRSVINSSAGSVLESFSSTSNSESNTSRSSTTRGISESQKATVISMGFSDEQVERAALRRLRSQGRGFETVEEIVEEIFNDSNVGAHAHSSVENVTLNGVDVPPNVGNQSRPTFSATLKRNSFSTAPEVEVEVMNEEVPLKKSKSGPSNQHTMEETLANLVLERNCRLCRQNVANVVIMPCGHLVLCSNCSKNNVTKCPVCKSMVTELIKTFLA